jgi:hypothetical protein
MKRKTGATKPTRLGGIAVALAAALALPGAAGAVTDGPHAARTASQVCPGNPTLGSGDLGYQIRCLVNQVRKRYHRAALTDSRPLNAAAHEYADNLARGGSSATPEDLVRANGYCRSGSLRLYNAVYVGSSPEGAVQFWMTKKGTRAAILDRRVKDIGRRGVTANPLPRVGDVGTYVALLGTCTGP